MKVLIVEDDTNIRMGLSELLSGHGYDVIEASNGETGLEKFRSDNPDLVCLDIMMPKKSGYDLCRAIRAVNEEIPIIFITAKAEEIDKVLGLELGADDYILKPFGSHEVIARIRAITRRAYREQLKTAISHFVFGDLQVEPSELRARRLLSSGELNEEVIDLTLREISILELFARNSGKVLDRDVILDHAWGKNYIPNSRTLDQTISTLRKKIESDPKNPKLIQTVHGSGYRYAMISRF
ncbi:MAG TPA: response regulator transcription factor [Oligoflexia bacterium]|nr:response regulator transcription factor [Oligoflexia bacterium]HMP49236.1 response regulator transcription factor [Oligoflexia bacterium]